MPKQICASTADATTSAGSLDDEKRNIFSVTSVHSPNTHPPIEQPHSSENGI